jgi:hypothetical protein
MAYESQLASQPATPAYLASLKMLIECYDKIKELKMMVGAWGNFFEGSGFNNESYEVRIRRIRKEKGLEESPVKMIPEKTLNVAENFTELGGPDTSKNDEIIEEIKEKAKKKVKDKKSKVKDDVPFLEKLKMDGEI